MLNAPRRRVRPADRRALERDGWRTLLGYTEDHVRDADGTLVAVARRWTAEAEDATGAVIAVEAFGPSPDPAWSQLRALATS